MIFIVIVAFYFYRCKELGLVEKCRLVEPRFASEQEILTVHTLHHLNLLKSTKDCNDLIKLEHMSSNYDSVYIHPVSRLPLTIIIVALIVAY